MPLQNRPDIPSQPNYFKAVKAQAEFLNFQEKHDDGGFLILSNPLKFREYTEGQNPNSHFIDREGQLTDNTDSAVAVFDVEKSQLIFKEDIDVTE